MKGYKTEESRLVGLFKKGRDTWREKALFRQEKIREMELTIRDKTLSRDKWKQRAKEAQKELAQKATLISKLSELLKRKDALLEAKEAEIELLKKKLNLLEMKTM